MMKKNKLTCLSLLTVLTLCLAFYSCTQDEIQNQNEIQKNANSRPKASDFTDIGEEHNRIMSDLLIDLTKNKESKRIDAVKFKSLIIKHTEKSPYFENDKDLNITSINKVFSRFNKCISKNTNRETDYIHNLEISNKAKEYLRTLNSYFYENDAISLIENLEYIIENDIDLNQKDLSVLLSGAEVGKYSYIYWQENLPIWIDALNDLESKKVILSKYNRERDCDNSSLSGQNSCAGQLAGDIVLADAGGAVLAAGTTWVVNAVPVGGQIAYGGAILTGAVGGSGMVVVSSVTDWIKSNWF